VYGDFDTAAPRAFVVRGSPPRVWGLRSRVGGDAQRRRFTPTCMGTSLSSNAGSGLGSVHPHVYGDFIAPRPGAHRPSGSPPRVWGLLPLSHRRRLRLRFTPTCMGTSSRWRTPESPRTVHPHVYGDFDTTAADLEDGYGSPPRVWGLRNETDNAPHHPRFTPTCMGTSSRFFSRHRAFSVHPHVYGDFFAFSRVILFVGGSPPRVWGLHAHMSSKIACSRFTPTCMGTSHLDPRVRRTVSVHPHVYGDFFF